MSSNLHPPRLANKLLALFCHPQFLEDIQGDLEEEFSAMVTDKTSTWPRVWYYWQILKLLRINLIKKPESLSIDNHSSMLRNYLKIGIRNLWKYKSGTLINVLGLSTGLAAFILIALFVKDELSYDLHHKNADNIYRLTVKNFNTDGAMSRHWAFASAGHASRIKDDYAEVTHAVRFYPWAFPDITVEGKKFPSEQVVFADLDVFDIFTFPFILGSPETAFAEPQSLVLTESTAIRLYGNDWKEKEIIGSRVKLERSGQQAPFTVTGVMEDMPDQQHFHFEYLAPISFVEKIFGENAISNVTGNYNWLTYLRLQDGTDPSSIEAKGDEFFDKYVGEFSSGIDAKDFYAFALQPLLSIHLNSNLNGEIENNGSIQQLLIFGIIGLLLLIVACINYMNLATSHFSRRMKEVGVRKVMGAHKSSLVKQFLTEAFLVNLLAFPVAILLGMLALPYLNDFMGKTLSLDFIANIDLLIGLVLLIMLVAVLSGSYPSLFLSKINLIQALKGESVINSNKWNFRNVLVTFQYVVTIGLIFTLLVIESQLSFIQNSDPGYRKDQIIHLSLSRNIDNLDVFKREMLNHPNISKGTYASRVPTGRLADSMGAGFFKNDSIVGLNFRLPFILIDEDFLETFEINLLAGENFTSSMDMQEDSVGYYLINNAAAKALGYTDPSEVIGKKLSYGQYNDQTMRAGRILGVTEDFHFESLHNEITPIVMLKASYNMNRLCMQVKPDDMASTLAHIESTWAQFDPERSARYRFLDEIFADQYQAEERLSTMITVFTLIAILIGCLGLIGMVGFVIDTKLKEIGIRKVLGASMLSIARGIGNRFLVLIGIAFLVAIPVAYYLISGWLDDFVYRTNISIWIIILPAIAVLLITAFSVGYQTIKASLVNPVECLKDE